MVMNLVSSEMSLPGQIKPSIFLYPHIVCSLFCAFLKKKSRFEVGSHSQDIFLLLIAFFKQIYWQDLQRE